MTDVTLRQMPEETMRRVKSEAALQGITIKHFVLNALEKSIREIDDSRKSTRGKAPRK